MTTLGIHYLTGCAVATDRTRSDRPEFPPHFGRVFMAMAATYFETRGSDSERAALEWLEAAGAPSMKAGKGHPRRSRGGLRDEAVKTYVPVNDKLDRAESTFPIPRSRQSRSFPTMCLDDPFVYLTWNAAVPTQLRDPLESLCRKVTRIGHSSSLVQMWVAEAASGDGEEWRPSDGNSGPRMRMAEPGTLRSLERAFNAKALEEYAQLDEALENADKKRKQIIQKQIAKAFPAGAPAPARPVLTRWQGYEQVSEQEEAAAERGPFSPDLVVLARRYEQKQDEAALNRNLGLEATLQLTSALRNAAMKAVGENPPEWLTGHQPDGKPSLKPHAAFFPLPYVSGPYGDGHILGLAIAIPREIEPQGETKEDSLRRVLGALLFHEKTGEEKTIRLWRSNKDSEKVWQWELRRETSAFPQVALCARTWTGPATDWASVTPVVLHHYPKRGRDSDVERILLEAFESAGIPRPAEIRVQPVSFFRGAGHVRTMPEFTEGGEKLCRYKVHVRVRFSSRVEGPVLVGRGRFRGYGLLRPLEVQHA